MAEKKYTPFSIEEAKKLARAGEKLESKGFVKTEGFEKAVVLLMSMTQAIWNLTQKNKSFRMELFYDAQTINTNYCFFTPIDTNALDDTKQEC